jgi:hypothetical protein
MQDWATFFFTGSSVLPAFMVLNNEEAFELALFVFIGLVLAACLAALRDEDCPARKVAAIDPDKHTQDSHRERD